MANKKTGKVIQMLSPENYIRQRARNLPIHECMITRSWEEDLKASIMIARKHSNGNFTVGYYLIDLGCLGIKDTYFKFNISSSEYQELVMLMRNEIELEEADYILVHNIIYAALEYAEELGFQPVKDFTQTMQYFLYEDNDEIELLEIECGYMGKPMFIRGPYDTNATVKRIISQLDKAVGPGNYTFVDEASDIFPKNDDWDDDFVEEEAKKAWEEMLGKKSTGFQFKVQLSNVTSPPVWRRMVIPSHYSFLLFHALIQDCFGWEDCHLYQFSIGRNGSTLLIKEIDDLDDPNKTLEASETSLSDIFSEEGQKIEYLYDFGDSWTHLLTLEKIMTTKISVPDCIDGVGQCPPEDCGGPMGYMRLKEILANPQHPEYAEMCNWLELDEAEQWDAKAFDLNMTRDTLKSFYSSER